MKKKTLFERSVNFLYTTCVGRTILKLLVNKQLSDVVGAFLNTKLSCFLIEPFIKRNHINMDEYEKVTYNSYNEFFYRNIAKGARVIPTDETAFIAPCDSRLTAYPISDDMVVDVKDTRYSLRDLLKSNKLANYYKGGTLLLFRLSVDDYHRYVYVESGEKSRNYRIPGVLHTVQPLANDVYPIYKENTREFCLIKTPSIGSVLMMEVGAMLVGKIANENHHPAPVTRGQEKGHFEFGGSTIIVCVKKGTLELTEELKENSRNNIETKVKLGEIIGRKMISLSQ